jgi:hypothetical protein
MSVTPLCLVAQQNDCDFYVESDHERTKNKIKYSSYSLNFAVTETIDVKLKLSTKRSQNIVELVLDFEDMSGLPTELGSTLSIKFIDGTTHSIIARTKKTSASVIYFTISESGLEYDRSIIGKLSKVDISVLAIVADYEQREIFIPETKATILKKTIQCLLNINKE